ncbi:MAG: phosphocholine cytidylyltransferase family protein [Pseudomonadales bacterium]|nr:phosphocholine cytidylyltransferase family protein [Pseudomonadales bacterium]
MMAVILAAGRGSRLGSLTDKAPKCFTEVLGKRLLDYQLAALRRAGITNIVLVSGYRANCFHEYADQVHLVHNESWDQGNMLLSLVSCEPQWRGQEFVISYSDIIYSSSIVRDLVCSPWDIGISYDPNWVTLWRARFGDELLDDAESFRIDNNKVIEIGNRVDDVKLIQGQYMGLLKFSPVGSNYLNRLLASLDKQQLAQWDMTRLLQQVIAEQELGAVPCETPWFEVDNQVDLQVAENHIRLNSLVFDT